MALAVFLQSGCIVYAPWQRVMRYFPALLLFDAISAARPARPKRTFPLLLAPCLLICLACATRFPFENIKHGMTVETAREEFGAPKATEAGAGTVE